jgi:hypothetical protein
MEKRKNGQEGIGPLRHEVRRDLLDRVVALDERTGLGLIGADEIRTIRLIWASEELDVLEAPALHAGRL